MGNKEINAGSEIRQGVKYTAISKYLTQGSQIIVSVALARILVPADYGLVAIAYAMTGYALLLGDVGMNAYLIHIEDTNSEVVGTVFTMQLALYSIIALVVVLCAPYYASLMDDERLVNIMYVLSVGFLLRALYNVPNALLTRKLQYKKIMKISVLSAGGSGAIAIALALAGFSYWSLITQNILSIVISSFAMIISASYVPRIVIRKKYVKSALAYGGRLTAHQSISYWSRYSDNVFIGLYLGNTSLGYYTRAYTFMMLIVKNIPDVIGKVMFPVLSRMKGDRSEIRRLYGLTMKSMLYATYPMLVFMALYPKSVLVVVYGSQWLPASTSLSILALGGMVQVLVFPVAWIYMSFNRVNVQLKKTVILSGLLLPALFVASRYSIEMVSIVVLALSIVSLFWHYIEIKRILGYGILELWGDAKRPLVVSTSPGFLCLGLSSVMGRYDTAEFLMTTVLLCVYLFVFYLLLRLIAVDDYLRLKKQLASLIAAKS
jgi:O-antigen/teichoic acid export membrane protein